MGLLVCSYQQAIVAISSVEKFAQVAKLWVIVGFIEQTDELGERLDSLDSARMVEEKGESID